MRRFSLFFAWRGLIHSTQQGRTHQLPPLLGAPPGACEMRELAAVYPAGSAAAAHCPAYFGAPPPAAGMAGEAQGHSTPLQSGWAAKGQRGKPLPPRPPPQFPRPKAMGVTALR